MDLNILNIMIGSACDMKCPYCMQEDLSTIANHKPDIQKFVSELKKYLKEKNIENIRLIQIWGGEPLLYFKYIKQLYPLISDLNFDKFRICTNGRKMSQEYVDFCNSDSKIYTTISCHDFGFSDEQIKLFMTLKDVIFTEVLNHKRTDLKDVKSWFYRIYNLTKIYPRFNVFPIYNTEICGEDYALTQGDLAKYYNYMVSENLEDLKNNDMFAIEIARAFMRTMNGHSNNRPNSNCTYKTISVDLNGNVYGFCHHDFSSKNITENISKKIIPIHESSMVDKIKALEYFKIENKCNECELGNFCSFKCPLEIDFNVMCFKNKILYMIYKIYKSTVFCQTPN